MKLEFHLIQTTKKNWNKNLRGCQDLYVLVSPHFFHLIPWGFSPLKPLILTSQLDFFGEATVGVGFEYVLLRSCSLLIFEQILQNKVGEKNGWDMEM